MGGKGSSFRVINAELYSTQFESKRKTGDC